MKSFDYLLMKRPVLTISPHIAMLCEGLQAHLMMKFGKLSDDWEPIGLECSPEEHLAHNTHTNAMLGFQQFPNEMSVRQDVPLTARDKVDALQKE